MILRRHYGKHGREVTLECQAIEKSCVMASTGANAHFQDEIIVLCLRWYLRYSLSYRDPEEMMAERGLSLDHSTIAQLGSTVCADSESTDSL